ncbi:MAG: hypothetical protein D6731_14795 [Planctomycetota bacterium]|nr:MAG: hypothetical protein D6731_14795 [Planctomycetota bacterium]
MDCPRACPTPLQVDQLVGIEVDRCPSCEGIWLDTGEGEIVTRPGEDIPAELLAQAAALDPKRPADTSDPLPCPRCGKTMGREVFSASGVEIDRCGCGVWLDKGELAKIRAYREEGLAALRRAYAGTGIPAEVYERAYSRFYFDLGTPPGGPALGDAGPVA